MEHSQWTELHDHDWTSLLPDDASLHQSEFFHCCNKNTHQKMSISENEMV
jgi:hypothetical protein